MQQPFQRADPGMFAAPEGQDLRHIRTSIPGGLMPPADTRRLSDGANIVELYPDIYNLSCGDATLTVDPANGTQQDIIVGRWNLPYDVGVLAIYYEIFLPDVAGVSNGYLLVGQSVPPQPQITHFIQGFDIAWSRISGSPGSKVRRQDNINPYFRRAVKGSDIIVDLQMFSVLGQAAYTVEYLVDVRVLRLGAMTASGR